MKFCTAVYWICGICHTDLDEDTVFLYVPFSYILCIFFLSVIRAIENPVFQTKATCTKHGAPSFFSCKRFSN